MKIKSVIFAFLIGLGAASSVFAQVGITVDDPEGDANTAMENQETTQTNSELNETNSEIGKTNEEVVQTNTELDDGVMPAPLSALPQIPVCAGSPGDVVQCLALQLSNDIAEKGAANTASLENEVAGQTSVESEQRALLAEETERDSEKRNNDMATDAKEAQFLGAVMELLPPP